MKKIKSVLFISLLAFGLAACNEEDVVKEEKKKETVSDEKRLTYEDIEGLVNSVNTTEKEVITYIDVPKKEIKAVMEETEEERSVFVRNQSELDKLFIELKAGKKTAAEFKKGYTKGIEELTKQVENMEKKAKKDGLHKLEKQFIAYYKTIIENEKTKQQAVNEKGNVDYKKIDSVLKGAEQLEAEYQALFEKMELEEFAPTTEEEIKKLQEVKVENHSHDDEAAHSHENGKTHTHKDGTTHSHD